MAGSTRRAWRLAQPRGSAAHAALRPRHRPARHLPRRRGGRHRSARGGRQAAVDLVVIGPGGTARCRPGDARCETPTGCLGPGAEAARIEGSKSFAKDVLRAAGVPTAEELAAPRVPCVVKADGLAAGKGVFVCETEAELAEALPREALGGSVAVEEFLEVATAPLSPSTANVAPDTLAPAQDFKRLLDDDRGSQHRRDGERPPVPWLEAGEAEALTERVHLPVLRELSARGSPFQGLLYAGLMLTEDRPRVPEFNCRFGDPETQAILPRLEGDLLEALAAVAEGSLAGIELVAGPESAATVVFLAGCRVPGRARERRADRRARRGGGRGRGCLPRRHGSAVGELVATGASWP